MSSEAFGLIAAAHPCLAAGLGWGHVGRGQGKLGPGSVGHTPLQWSAWARGGRASLAGSCRSDPGHTCVAPI